MCINRIYHRNNSDTCYADIGPIVKENIQKFAREHIHRPVQAVLAKNLKTRGSQIFKNSKYKKNGQINYRYNRYGHREEIETTIPDPLSARKTEEISKSVLNTALNGNVSKLKVFFKEWDP